MRRILRNPQSGFLSGSEGGALQKHCHADKQNIEHEPQAVVGLQKPEYSVLLVRKIEDKILIVNCADVPTDPDRHILPD